MSTEGRFRIFKDPVSSWTHFIGLWLALVAVTALVWRVADDGPKAASMAIYGATLVTLFLASSLYHWLDIGERGNRWLQRLDHSAVFLLIAGTYVPRCCTCWMAPGALPSCRSSWASPRRARCSR